MDFNTIEELLELPEFRVVEERTTRKDVLFVLERKESPMLCPRCGTPCKGPIQHRTRACIRDLPMGERQVRLAIRVRRFRCPHCGARPWEQVETIKRKQRWTPRLIERVREQVLQQMVPIKAVAKSYGVPARTVFRWVFERGGPGRRRKLGRVLGIDDFAKAKGQRYATHVVDLVRGRTVGVIPSRTKDDLLAWFRARPPEELAGVEVVVIDMSKTYAAAVREVFDRAVLVVDRFHVVKLAVEALGDVVRAIRRRLSMDERKRLAQMRRKWLLPGTRLGLDEFVERLEWLRRFPEIAELIDWVNDLRRWFERHYVKPARRALEKLIERASKSTREPLRKLAGTLTRWFKPLIGFLKHRYTNGRTEGYNTKIKLIQRAAYGLRNDRNRELRIKAACGAH